MPDDPTRCTAWLAMSALAASAGVRACGQHGWPVNDEIRRWFWTAAGTLLWIHVAVAFHFEHHWSHTDAYAHTARRTAGLTGFDWGGGLYFNYALLLVWAADAGWWWFAPRSYRGRPAIISAFVNGFVAFMAINATVVFGSGLIRWFAAATALILGLCALRCRNEEASL